MTNFYNFDPIIEASCAEKVVKSILETWNAANDVIVCASFIHSRIKNFKNMECNKQWF